MSNRSNSAEPSPPACVFVPRGLATDKLVPLVSISPSKGRERDVLAFDAALGVTEKRAYMQLAVSTCMLWDAERLLGDKMFPVCLLSEEWCAPGNSLSALHCQGHRNTDASNCRLFS